MILTESAAHEPVLVNVKTYSWNKSLPDSHEDVRAWLACMVQLRGGALHKMPGNKMLAACVLLVW
jgi:hypothetical protein